MDRTQRTPFLVPQRTAVPAAGRSLRPAAVRFAASV